MKNLLVIILAALLFATPSWGAVAYVQSAGDYGAGTSNGVAFSGNTAAGSLIVVVAFIRNDANTVSSITDTQGLTYSTATASCSNGNGHLVIAYAENAQAAANTITVTLTSSGEQWTSILEYSGVATSTALDQVTCAATSADPASSGNVTTTQDGELLIGAMASQNYATVTPSGSWTARITQDNTSPGSQRLIVTDQLDKATGTYAATFNNTGVDSLAVGIATFKAASSATVARRRSVVY